MKHLITSVNAILWGAPALILILGVGLYLSVCLGFPQIRFFPRAMKDFFHKLRPARGGKKDGSFQALCTALAATVGTGNLVGVAGAVCLGGPGAVFWMWICGFVGMAAKYAEATLAVRYRIPDGDGFAGGPMYVITRGLGGHSAVLAKAYCLFGIIASFGVGNVAQINSVVSGFHEAVGAFGRESSRMTDLFLGVFLAGLIGSVLLGGAKRIGALTEKLIPVMSAGYILLCAGVLLVKAEAVPGAFVSIVAGAFSPRSVTGGMLGSAFQALRIGCSRGVFTNEAGLGTASIAHAGASVSHPCRQGLMGIVEVFLDTHVICTLTAVVILASGVPIPYGTDAGGTLTGFAFASVYGRYANVFLSLALGCFAVATVLGWGLYGGRCAEFLLGPKAWKYFSIAQTAAVALGAVLDTGTVWQFSEAVNGLMLIPNLIALAALTPELRRLTIDFRKKEWR